ncbi:MAG: cyclodeaminase/cyclohydrolase family protein [Desulfobaccales bacterium]
MNAFLKRLARAQPNPGGGAAAAFGARLGLALLEKVARLEGQRPVNPAAGPGLAWEETLARLRRLADLLGGLQERDVQAYARLAAAQAAGDAERLTAAAQEAVGCPEEIARQAAEALKLLAWAGERCRRHLLSDLLVGCEFLGAALRGAHHIAGANLPQVGNAASRQDLARKLRQARQRHEDLYRRVQGALLARSEFIVSNPGS